MGKIGAGNRAFTWNFNMHNFTAGDKPLAGYVCLVSDIYISSVSGQILDAAASGTGGAVCCSIGIAYFSARKVIVFKYFSKKFKKFSEKYV